MFRRRAFTLVELLVVISIIGLLSTVAVVSLESSRVKARNAKRVGDVRQLITALEMFNSANGYYPSSGGADAWACMSGAACLGEWYYLTENTTLDSLMLPYMAKKPTDPNQGKRVRGGYIYNSTWTGSAPSFVGGVVLVYVLERPSTCELGRFFDQAASFTECAYEFK